VKALWLRAPNVQCIHPFEKRSSGYSEVVSSWARLFEVAKARKSTISADDVRVSVRGSTATVVCLEQVVSKAMKRPLRSMLATNIFRKVGSQWLLFHRHVSTAHNPDSAGDGSTLLLDETERNQSNVDLFAKLASIPGAHIVIKQGKPPRGFGDVDEDDEVDEVDEEMLGGAFFDSEEGDDFRGIPGPSRSLSGDNTDSDEDGEDEDPEMYLEEVLGSEGPGEDSREAVRALRRLSREGKLSQKAKVQLLGEMIRRPGDSMVERAHQLLLSGAAAEEKQAAWVDFADLVASEARKMGLEPPAKGKPPGKRKRPRRKSDAGETPGDP